MGIPFPSDVRQYVRRIFRRCNNSVSKLFSKFPAYREESLDLHFIAQLSAHQKPVRLKSEWTVRIEVHFMGGGRHFRNFEAADIGIMMVFRRRGQVFRS